MKKNHKESAGLWLRIAKKDSNVKSVSYKDALEVALCYGWIDAQKKPESEHAWLQRFVPRSATSLCLAAIENAKRNGRWEAAYDSPSAAAVPGDFESALNANPKAKAFFETLDRANRYAILWRIQTVKKSETRARKIAQFVDMLTREEKIHK